MDQRPVEAPVSHYLYGIASEKRVPISGTFELTPLCNVDCKMGYVKLSRAQQEALGPLRTAADWTALAKSCADAGLVYLLITGGEPLTHPEFQEILEGLAPLGFLMSINTNGTLIDENKAALLRDCGVLRANVSLYGMSRDAYARLCGDGDCFEKAMAGIRNLLAVGIRVKLSFSLTPQNADQLPLVAAFAEQEGLVLQVASYLFPPLRRDPTQAGAGNRFPPKQAAYHAAYADLLTLGKERFLSFDATGFAPPEEDDCTAAPDGIRCRAGKCSFWITWQGVLTPCGMFPTEGWENAMETTFPDAWERVVRRVEEIRLPAKCAVCDIRNTCRACAAMVLTESGSFHRAPQYRCEMMEAYPEGWKRIKEKYL